MDDPPRFHRGSCICNDCELRLTRRCLVDDLGFREDSTFEEASGHPIVDAFISQRGRDPLGTKTVGPEAGKRTIYRLARGHDHRGATWYDERHSVVWLCAYARHRSGEPDDAFPYFRDLMAGNRMFPGVPDYELLFSDQGNRFAELAVGDAQEALERAVQEPGSEVETVLGLMVQVSVVVHSVDDLREIYVSFSLRGLTQELILVLLAAFRADAEFGDWELIGALPNRALRDEEAEIGYRLLEPN